MIVKSHIDLFIPNPLVGRYHHFKRVDDGKPVSFFEPTNDAYSPELRKLLWDASSEYKL